MSFSDTFDATVAGGLAGTSFSGSFLWETTTPVGGGLTAFYTPSSATLAVGGTDYSSRIWYTNLTVTNAGIDRFELLLGFTPFISLGAGPDINFFRFSFFDSSGSMLSSTALPTNLAAVLSPDVSRFYTFQLDSIPATTIIGSIPLAGISPVPDHATSGLLMALGLAGLAAFRNSLR